MLRTMIPVNNLKYIITYKFIMSDIYKDIILKYTSDDDNDWFLQEKNSDNFSYRHGKLKALGAWRWLPNYKHRDIIANFVFSESKGIDFGGDGSPIFGNTEIIDIAHNRYRQLNEINDEELDYIYTSHTLEHIQDLDSILKDFYRILKIGGFVIIIVPSFSCKRWRAGNPKNTHVHTFAISGTRWARIDKLLKKIGFQLIYNEYSYDNCIFIVARKC